MHHIRTSTLRSVRLRATFVLTAMILLAPNEIRADGFSETFAREVDRAAPGDLLTGILVLEEQVDLAALRMSMRTAEFETRWRRHTHVLLMARELAARTQGPLLAELESRVAQGEVIAVRPYWVVNAVAVTAPASTFHDLAARGDVALVEAAVPVEVRAGASSGVPQGPRIVHARGDQNPSLAAVRAPEAWALGYTGRGRLVAQLDFAPDGDHPALSASWRGRRPEVPWYHAWNDPSGRDTQEPTDFNTRHGTQVLGIMVGRPPLDDPIGVAHDAEWIAGDIRSVDTAGILGLFEWIADPDSNLATVDDVPDVVNNSWGTDEDCAETYWAAIDLVELAGVANVVAVANSGEQGDGRVRSPESRAATPFQNFSVGAVDARVESLPVYSRSGRGPSPCDDTSIKPELTAPGVGVYTTDVSFGSPFYGPTGTGTSMAAPFVSAGIALLRQAHPDLLVDEAKDLLMATARDLGPHGEDNTFGHGILDLPSALQLLFHRTNPRPYPTLPTASLVEVDSVVVVWSAPITPTPTDSVLAYRVYRTLDGELFPKDPAAEVGPTAFTWTDPDLAPGTYLYVVTARYPTGESGPSRTVRVDVVDRIRQGSPTLSTADAPARLSGSPNPFSPGTTLQVAMPGGWDGPVTVTLHDVGGRRVRTLHGMVRAGVGQVHWDGRGDDGRTVAAGVYFARLRVDGVKITERLIRVR